MRVGIDLVSIERIAGLVSEHPRCEAQLFAEQELVPADGLKGRRRQEFLAGRFAVKEAFMKAVGGPGGIEPRDIACLVGRTGEPRLELRDSALTAMERAGCANAFVSISHDAGIAVAVVVILEGPPGG